MAKAKKGKAAAGGGGGGPKEMLLVASKVRQMIKDAGCNTAGSGSAESRDREVRGEEAGKKAISRKACWPCHRRSWEP